MNKHFHLFFLITLLFLTPRVHAIRNKFSAPSSQQQGFQNHHPWRNDSSKSSRGTSGDDYFSSEKRRVPTGSNPLHNKR